MRAPVIALALAACAEPVGRTQEWPPSRGITVQSVVAGHLDGDGASEIVVMASGDEHQAGLYLIHAKSDLALGTSFPIATFTAYWGITGVANYGQQPGAVSIVPGATPTIWAAFADDFYGLLGNVYDGTLENTTYYDANIEKGSALLWQRPVTFPGNMTHVIVSNGVSVHHFDPAGVGRLIPAPNMPSPWMTAQLATTYTSGPDQIVCIATPTTIFAAPLPTSADEMTFSWGNVRDGVGWLGQSAFDLGVGHDAIVGVDMVGHQVCAVDPAQPGEHCLALPGGSANTDVAMALMPTPTGHDLVITFGGAAMTDIAVISNVRLDGSGLTGTATMLPSEALPHGRPVIVTTGAGTQPLALVMATDGHVKCVRGCCTDPC